MPLAVRGARARPSDDRHNPGLADPPTTPTTLPPRRLLAVPALALLWGLNWPAVKVVLGEVAPWTLRSMGMGGAALLLFGLALARGRSLRVRRAQWPRLVVAGLLSVAAFNVLVAFAQLAGSTARAAIVTYTMPVWAIALAWLVLGEQLDWRRRIALLLGVAGLLLLALPLLRAGQLPRGVFYALAAGFCWAAGTVFIKRYPIDAVGLVSTAWQLLIGSLSAGAGMLLFEGLPVPKALSAAATVALAFHIVLATATAYFIWFEVVARLPAGIAALGTLVVPVVGVSSAMALLGERPSGYDLGGFALIIAAAAMALLRGRPATPARTGRV
jgi:drug/metabolite transporter (DMT)-like permease